MGGDVNQPPESDHDVDIQKIYLKFDSMFPGSESKEEQKNTFVDSLNPNYGNESKGNNEYLGD